MVTELESLCSELITVRETIKGLKLREEALKVVVMQELEDLEDDAFETNGYKFALGTRTSTIGWDLPELQDRLPPAMLRDIVKVSFKEGDLKKLAKTLNVNWSEVSHCKITDEPKLTLSVRKLSEMPGVFGKVETNNADL